MRRRLVLTATVLFSFALFHCVGDEPAGSSSPDGSSNDGSTQGDGASGGDGSSITDAGADASKNPPDMCVGFTDCPNDIEGASLQLWLRGGFDVDCETGRIANWKDQSGKGHDATPGIHSDGGLAASARCGAATIHTIDVAAFGAPSEIDAGSKTEFVDETLDVDLDWADSTDYTFFVVQERASDAIGGFFAQDNTEKRGSLIQCHGFVTDPEPALLFGYDEPLSASSIGLSYSQGCSNGTSDIDTFAPATVEVDELVFAQATGHVMYVNGTEYYVGDQEGDDLLVLAGGGYGVIGRGTSIYIDTRFLGNIAEIVGYSRALTAPERLNIEGYLKRQWGLTF